jgi:hypothetical protein
MRDALRAFGLAFEGHEAEAAGGPRLAERLSASIHTDAKPSACDTQSLRMFLIFVRI